MWEGGRNDAVNGLHDAAQRRVGADGHVGAAEVVVDGADDAHDVEVRIVFQLLVGDQLLLPKFGQKFGPFVPEQVGSGQGTVAADDDKVCNASVD